VSYRTSLALGVLLAAVCVMPLHAMAGPAAGQVFFSAEGRFAVAFPAAPVQDRADRETWAGRMEEGGFEVVRTGLRLRVEFHDVPRMATLVVPPMAILELAKQGVVSDMDARDVSAESNSLRGHPGLALRYHPGARPDSTEETHLFLVGTRLYLTFARADVPGEPRALASRFLESFDAWDAGDAVASAAGNHEAGM
jgi:hypothetical protein